MAEKERAVLVLGMFDGVHVGHRTLVERAKHLAIALDASCTAYTFSNHPAELIGKNVKLLCSAEEKEYLLRDCGADSVFMEPFTEDLMHMPPEAFIDMLLSGWDVQGLVAGCNFTFGDRGEGNADTLQELGKKKGFIVRILPAVTIDGETVSSTGIRKKLDEGDVTGAARSLGRCYTLSGAAEPADGGIVRIRPDASIVIPGEGLYRTQILTEGGTFEAMTKTYPADGFAECMISGIGAVPDGADAMIVFRTAY